MSINLMTLRARKISLEHALELQDEAKSEGFEHFGIIGGNANERRLNIYDLDFNRVRRYRYPQPADRNAPIRGFDNAIKKMKVYVIEEAYNQSRQDTPDVNTSGIENVYISAVAVDIVGYTYARQVNVLNKSLKKLGCTCTPRSLSSLTRQEVINLFTLCDYPDDLFKKGITCNSAFSGTFKQMIDTIMSNPSVYLKPFMTDWKRLIVGYETEELDLFAPRCRPTKPRP